MADDPRAGELATTNYHWTLPTVGASDDAWGDFLNQDLISIDSIVHSIDTRVIPPGGAIVSDTPPASPTPGMLWFDSVGGQTYVWYSDSNTSQWVLAVSAAQGPQGPTGSQGPAGPNTLPMGVTNGSDAAPGQIGEIISSAVPNPGAAITSGVPKNVTTLPLTAGDWDVQGEVGLVPSAVTLTTMVGAISSTSAASDPVGVNASRNTISGSTTFGNVILPLRPCRVSLSASATYYLIASATFASGTCTAYGNIWARRAR